MPNSLNNFGTAVGAPEIATQQRLIELFEQNLHYTYLGDLSEEENQNIRTADLGLYLTKCGYSAENVNGAIAQLHEAANDLSEGLYKANKDVYSLLRYGVKVQQTDGSYETVKLIDFGDPTANDFAVAEEVTVSFGDYTKRPDLVIYVNGIALGVIELKKASVTVMNGICQNINNQGAMFIKRFFTTMQLVCAGNSSEGLRYGTVETAAKFYLEWKHDGYDKRDDEKEPEDEPLEQAAAQFAEKLDRQVYEMFSPRRFLEIVRNFVIFDKGKKKLCRYTQFYGIRRALKRLKKNEGGIIWHSQGSGKSLTMVWLSKLVIERDTEARVLIVTDRDELDDQIEKLYLGVDEGIVRTKSCKHLLDILNDTAGGRLVCSLIHKFGHRGKSEEEASEADYEKYLAELKASLPADFSVKGHLTVFVDECHRTQSGKLHQAMKAIMPDAQFIGFTGTPLLKKDKKTSLEVFGPYIHTYKFPEAVRDRVVLDLRYEARDIPQDVTAQTQIDAWFESKTQGLNDRAKAKLKEKWATMQKVYSSKDRLARIVEDIIFDFTTKPRLMDGAGNAMLVADSIYTACKFYELFLSHNFMGCAVISSYTPSPSDVATDAVAVDENTEAQEKFNTYLKMIGIDPGDDHKAVAKKLEDFEKEAKREFVEEPAKMKVLIVVDKLLTGFDAPKCTYLYLDKHMQDHGLFQAICRVNRLDNESKDFGYIVDYQKLFGDLQSSLEMYSSEVFKGYDKEDVEGLVKDIVKDADAHFRETLDSLEALCEGVEPPAKGPQYRKYFCGEGELTAEQTAEYAQRRSKLYALVGTLARAYAQLKPRMDDAGVSESDRQMYEKRVTFFLELKNDIGQTSGDFLDLRPYEPGMRYLIDTYINASESEKLNILDDFTLLDFIVGKEKDADESEPSDEDKDSVAETIENNATKELIRRRTLNPAFYEKMSAVLKKLMDDRKAGVLAYKDLLDEYRKLAESLKNPQDDAHYPPAIAAEKNPLLNALYDNFGEDEELAINLNNAILGTKIPGFQFNPAAMNQIKGALFEILQDEAKVEQAFDILVAQEEA